jgi:iduronate 2-sulfatase
MSRMLRRLCFVEDIEAVVAAFARTRTLSHNARTLASEATVLIACLCLTLLPAIATAAQHKNVLLLCVDDLRPVMGCYGGAAKTPNIDKLAKSAAVFTRHYNQWPVCGPSRASMLGGLRPDSTGIYEIGDSWKISKRPATHPTMPRHFRDNGYKTLSFGKVYHGKAIGKGYGWSETPWKLDWTCYVDFEYAAGNKQQWRPAYEIYDGPDSRHNDFQTAEKVIKALEINKDRPFFIAAGFYKPHLPFVAPKSYWDLYSVEEIGLIEPTSLPQGAADFMYNWSEISSYGDPDGKLFSGDSDVGEEQTLNMIHAYYACVSFIDAQVGRILKALEQNGLEDNTAVVIWSDHGFHLGDHGRWAKHTQFEQVMRCPLMFHLPEQQTVTGSTDAIVESVDIYPSLCEFAGLPIPDFVEGESLLPVLMGRSDGKEAAFSQIRPVNRKKHNLMAYSVRTADFRYVEWREPDRNNAVIWRELYDHRTDPEEAVNVVDDPDNAESVRYHERLVSANYRSLQ